MRVEQTQYVVPTWGVGELWTADGVVLAHDFTFEASAASGDGIVTKAAPPMGAHGPPTGTVPSTSKRMGNGFVPKQHRHDVGAHTADPSELAERFVAFFRGETIQFGDVALDLGWATPFQRVLVDTLRQVPRGEVVSYGELAAIAGHPGAQRAVGTFCARNRFMLLVPCHRVVGADGIGGYGSAGVSVKRRLLALEGISL